MKVALRFVIVFLVALSSFGFSLLGPYAPWMTAENGFQPGVGGPMQLGAGYRWNVPVVNYGFDDSFINFFGERGVAAVEEAMRQLNSISTADISTIPTSAVRLNFTAQSLGLIDMKSIAMSAALEQMGLGEALRNIYVIRAISKMPATTNYSVVQRNFDPATYAPSDKLNGVRFTFDVHPFPDGTFDAIEVQINQAELINPGIAGTFFSPGQYAVNLTQDDVGGLRYLYATNSFKMETLLPGIEPIDGALVNQAVRPGRGKITFARQSFNFPNGAFEIVTNRFADIYLESGVLKTQYVRRVVTSPDIIFSAADLGVDAASFPILLAKTPASNWINNSALTGQPGEGPGVIAPSATVTFAKALNVWGTFSSSAGYYNFDASSDRALPKLEVISREATTLTLRLTGIKRKYTISTSTDFTTWSSVTTLSNETTTTFQVPLSGAAPTFFRAVEGALF